MLGDRRDIALLAGSDHLLDRRGQPVELGVVDGAASLGEGTFLEQGTDRVDRLDLTLAHADDDGAAVWIERDKALLLELTERLTDGTAADPELGREGDLEQPRACRDLAAQYPGPEAQEDVLAEDAPLDGREGGPDGHRSTSWTFGRRLDARDDQTLDCRQSTRAT